jgi:hypothetical protein
MRLDAREFLSDEETVIRYGLIYSKPLLGSRIRRP